MDRDPEVTYIVNCVCEFGRQLIDVLRSLPVWLVAVVGIKILDYCDNFWLIALIALIVKFRHQAKQIDQTRIQFIPQVKYFTPLRTRLRALRHCVCRCLSGQDSGHANTTLTFRRPHPWLWCRASSSGDHPHALASTCSARPTTAPATFATHVHQKNQTE